MERGRGFHLDDCAVGFSFEDLRTHTKPDLYRHLFELRLRLRADLRLHRSPFEKGRRPEIRAPFCLSPLVHPVVKTKLLKAVIGLRQADGT